MEKNKIMNMFKKNKSTTSLVKTNSKICFCCKIEFKGIFKAKWRCSKCLNSFCRGCCDNLKKGICDFCFKKAKMETKLKREAEETPLALMSNPHYSFRLRRYSDIMNLILKETVQELNPTEELLSSFLKDLPLSWAETLKNITIKVSSTVKPSFKHLKDSLDLRDYIQILTIQTENPVEPQFRTGIAFEGTFNAPFCFQNSLILVVKDAKKQINIAEWFDSLLEKVSPDLIITDLEDEMLIGVKHKTVVRTDTSNLRLIARIAQTIAIETSNEPDQLVLGILKEATAGKEGRIVEVVGVNQALGCSVILQHSDENTLSLAKKALSRSIFALRSFRLEQNFFSIFTDLADLHSFNAHESFIEHTNVTLITPLQPQIEANTEEDVLFSVNTVCSPSTRTNIIYYDSKQNDKSIGQFVLEELEQDCLECDLSCFRHKKLLFSGKTRVEVKKIQNDPFLRKCLECLEEQDIPLKFNEDSLILSRYLLF